MKRLTRLQKVSAVLGAGLLIAAASGSALAMRMAEVRSLQGIEVQPTAKPATFTSPLPQPGSEHEVEFTGTVEAIAGDMWVVGGRTVMITATTEIKPGLDIGSLAEVQAVQQADGTLAAREIKSAVESNDNGNVNSNDNGNVNSNDNSNDNQGNVNSNEDHGNSNDDHDGNVNSNDDDGNSNENGNVNSNDNHENSNDDHGSNTNSNDNHSNTNDHEDESNDHAGNSGGSSHGDDGGGGHDQHNGHGD